MGAREGGAWALGRYRLRQLRAKLEHEGLVSMPSLSCQLQLEGFAHRREARKAEMIVHLRRHELLVVEGLAGAQKRLHPHAHGYTRGAPATAIARRRAVMKKLSS